jgi:hypothetical protein
MFKYFTILIFISGISGCNPIDTYYINSEESIKKRVDGITSNVYKKNLEILFASMRYQIKIEKDKKISMKVMITHDFKDYVIDEETMEGFKKLGTPSIQELTYCDYFDEKNWNCGENSKYKDRFIMSNGDLSNGEMKLIKKYRLK